MKQLTVLLSATLLIVTTAFAQSDNPIQTKEQTQSQIKSQTQTQTKADVQNREQINHGEAVSTTAKSTEPGPGKGEVVREVARTQSQKQNFIDKDGDGICDNKDEQSPNAVMKQAHKRTKASKGEGPGNKGIGPKDGTGYGAAAGKGSGAANCDGTGPKGVRGGKK